MNSERTWISATLFTDIVSYSKHPVDRQVTIKDDFQLKVSSAIQHLNKDELVLIDTGDGVAISFLGAPEALLPIAKTLCSEFQSNDHQNEYKVKLGINLGPLQVVEDLNNNKNCIGTGINDAQRVMSFSPDNQLLISKSYYDVLVQISDQYAADFQFQGIEIDKHGQEHSVYLLSSSNSVNNNSKPSFTIEPVVLERISKDFSCYVSKSAAELIIQQHLSTANNLKQFCELLMNEIKSSDDLYDFKHFLKECGYIGY